MVESIYFLKPAWCGTHFAGLWPEQGLQPVTRATALRRWFVTDDPLQVALPLLLAPPDPRVPRLHFPGGRCPQQAGQFPLATPHPVAQVRPERHAAPQI